MDPSDLTILRELVSDSRLSYREIARRVGLSVGTVISRIKNLEESGVIRGYSTVVDAEKLGYDVVAVIEIIITEGKLAEVEGILAENPNVYGVYDVTGASDAIVIARFRDRKELSSFIKSILRMKYVQRTITHVVLGTMKEDFRVPIPVSGSQSGS